MRTFRYNGSFLSLLLLTTVTVLVIAFLFIKLLPVAFANMLYFCQQFISNTLFQISYPVQIVLLIVIVLALSLGSLSFLIQVIKTKRLVNMLMAKRVVLSPRLGKIAASLQLKDKIFIVEDTNSFSFCAGILHPRILITTSLIHTLSDKELESVFLHEKAHIQNLDPFKMLFGKTITWLFFFLPIFSEINKNMQATSEILADRFVTSFQQDDKYLRNALKKILRTPQKSFAFTPAIANPEYLEIRIHRLVNPKRGQSFRVSWMSIATSILFLLFMIFLLQTPASAFNREDPKKISSIMCASNNACSQECQSTLSTSSVSTHEDLFFPLQQTEKKSSFPIRTTEPKPLRYR